LQGSFAELEATQQVIDSSDLSISDDTVDDPVNHSYLLIPFGKPLAKEVFHTLDDRGFILVRENRLFYCCRLDPEGGKQADGGIRQRRDWGVHKREKGSRLKAHAHNAALLLQ
jgi:hypothetical protein